MDAIETFKQGELTIKFYQDDDTESPKELECPENGVFLITTHNSYFEVIPEGFDVAEISEHMRTYKLYHGHKVYPLYAYVHSGVALSLGRGYPFNDVWDSGQIGWVLVRRDAVGKGKADQAAESLVEVWNQYLSGDVWFYVIEDEDGNNLESCGGMYGFEYCKTEAIAAAKGIEANQRFIGAGI